MNQDLLVPQEGNPARMLVQVPPPAPWPSLPVLPTTRYDPLFIAEGQRTHVDPMLLKAGGWQESSVTAHPPDSSTGAQGLMQLEPATQKMVGVTRPYDPHQSIWGGASYLAHLLWQQDGKVQRALQQYNGSPLSQADDPDSYASKVFQNYAALTGRQAPTFLSQFVRPHPTRGPEPEPDIIADPRGIESATKASMTPVPAGIRRDKLGDPVLDDRGNLIMNPVPTAGSGQAATPIQPPPPPMLRPGSTTTPPPIHPSMNMGPSIGPNLAQYEAAPAAAAQMWSGGPATSQQDVQPASALASRGQVPLPQLTSQPPSPFIQAFLNNAIFGSPTGARIGSMPGLDPTSQLLMGSGFNGSSPLSPNGVGPSAWPWGRRGS
jgi:hypothetical protein